VAIRLSADAPATLAGSSRGRQDLGQQQHDRSRGEQAGPPLCETPVGFKWFVRAVRRLVGFGGEESAGASFLRKDGTVWTTAKMALIMNLLAAEITARTGKIRRALP